MKTFFSKMFALLIAVAVMSATAVAIAEEAPAEAPAPTGTIVTEAISIEELLTPAPAENTAAAETPAPTDAPAASDTPAVTDTPAATDTPAPTDTPAVTETPAASEAPTEGDPTVEPSLEPSLEPTVTPTEVPAIDLSNVTINTHCIAGSEVQFGDVITVVAQIEGLGGVSYTMQWQYYDGSGWHDQSGANDSSYSFTLSKTNASYQWRMVVTVA